MLLSLAMKNDDTTCRLEKPRRAALELGNHSYPYRFSIISMLAVILS